MADNVVRVCIEWEVPRNTDAQFFRDLIEQYDGPSGWLFECMSEWVNRWEEGIPKVPSLCWGSVVDTERLSNEMFYPAGYDG